MTSNFRNPDDFLGYVRNAYANPMSSVESEANLEFRKITDHRAQGLAIPDNPHDHIVSQLWQEIQTAVPPGLADGARRMTAVGSLDNLSVNALCVRSAEGFIAIVVNRGLLTFFNKVSKLLVAGTHANSVVYCNRGPAEQITPTIAHGWFMEVCEHYRDTGRPLGPQMHLSPSATLQHGYQLHAWELFVLAHEVGHVAAGHLDDAGACLRNPAFGMLSTYRQNKSHIQEAEADVFAYRVLRRLLVEDSAGSHDHATSSIDDRRVLINVITLFNLLSLIGAGQSDSHPDPLYRLCNIAAEVYGEHIAEQLARSYEEKDLLATLFSGPLLFNPSPM